MPLRAGDVERSLHHAVRARPDRIGIADRQLAIAQVRDDDIAVAREPVRRETTSKRTRPRSLERVAGIEEVIEVGEVRVARALSCNALVDGFSTALNASCVRADGHGAVLRPRHRCDPASMMPLASV